MTPRFIAMRNNVPCQLVELDVPYLPRIKTVLLPSPIPPTPYLFRTAYYAQCACNRTKRAERRLSEAIIADFVRKSHPHLEPLFKPAIYTVAKHAVRKQEAKS